MFGIGEVALLLIVIILIFGAKKLPELARSAGKSARILKAEAKAMKEERKTEEAQNSQNDPQVIEGKVMPHQTADPQPERNHHTTDHPRHQQ